MNNKITKQRIDFSQIENLKDSYSPLYAIILDNVFTPEECINLVSKATSSTPSSWTPAGMNMAALTENIHTDFRNSDRIILIDSETSNWIYERLRPYVEEIWKIPPKGEWSAITGKVGRKQGPTWKLVGANPRLSFLRYGPGHYFKRHCDGLVDLEEEGTPTHKSFVTFHIYLNDSDYPNPESSDATVSASPLVGGATRFHAPSRKPDSGFLDVEPKLGRVLIFQQRMLIHSGEEVIEGVKYSLRSDFMYEQQ